MALNLNAVGTEVGPADVSWDARDAMLYALGVGAGQRDAHEELRFTTENSAGHELAVLPTYAVVLIQRAGVRPDMGPVDRTRLVHAEQSFVLHRPLPVQGKVQVTTRITGMYDKGSGALVSTRSRAVDAATGEVLVEADASSFVRGEGGFGGDRGPAGAEPCPTRKPDLELTAETRPDQALLYRLSGDRNPLHSDPAFARRGGFSGPILHGMCTYGITGRLLLQAVCGGDPTRLRSMSARFTRPVMPGDALTVQAWVDGATVRFRTLGAGGQPVMDFGTIGLVA